MRGRITSYEGPDYIKYLNMMKNRWTFMTLAALFFTGLFSCNVREETGSLQLGITDTIEETLKSAASGLRITAALVTITAEDGQPIYEKERISLYNFGDSYTSSSLELPAGNFQLAEFMLIDSAGVVRWATPRHGSELAGLVGQPLPRSFGIRPDETTTLMMEVVRIGEYQPSDFGYASFEIAFIERFCFQVYYESDCLDQWNDSILGPDGSEAPVYRPMLSIWSQDRRLLYEPLDQGFNRYQMPLMDGVFYLEATDCRGEVVYRGRAGLDQLLAYPCRDNAPALLIYRDSVPEILITPEGLTGPTIAQGVFGKLTLGLDDFMLIDTTDIMPVVRNIYFYPYAVVDSIYAMSPIDCHFPIQLIGTDPVAVVRTNSEGVYQIRLGEGEYLYLVEDGDQYYLDAYVSSHRPGHVEVFKDSVTERHIHLIDCSMWM